MDIFHRIPVTAFEGQYFLDSDMNISAWMHFIYCTMNIGFFYCSEWIGIL